MNPFMSIIVISYNMNRELPRTLYSMSASFQRDISSDDYEVILVDNGSKNPPKNEDFPNLDMDLSIHHFENPTHSPVAAVNFGLNKASGQLIGVFIDGARILSPRLLATAREGLSLSPRSVVGTRGRYLGNKFQRELIEEGYDAAVEDKLLAASGWQTNGYRLFDISVFDESAGITWFGPLAESNALFMSRHLWQEIGGFDKRFTSAGGGLVNLDTWKRAVTLPGVKPIILLGESTFHQVHGGVATNGSHQTIHRFFDEYTHIHGEEFESPKVQFSYLGNLHHGIHMDEGFTLSEEEKKTRNLRKALRTAISRSMSARFSAPTRQKLRTFYDWFDAVVRLNPIKGIRNLMHERSQARMLEGHALFDSEWYAKTYPDVVAAGYKPSSHYIRHGATQGTSPSPIFDAAWYLEHYWDVKESGQNPLLHYLTFGEKEGRRVRFGPQAFGEHRRHDEESLREILEKSELFDPDWYVTTYIDVGLSGLDPHIHYLRFGRLGRRNPSQNFDGVRYLLENEDVQLLGVNPVIHYETHGRAEGRTINRI